MKAYCRDLGQMDYKTCWELQQGLFDALVARKAAAKAQRNRRRHPWRQTPTLRKQVKGIRAGAGTAIGRGNAQQGGERNPAKGRNPQRAAYPQQ